RTERNATMLPQSHNGLQAGTPAKIGFVIPRYGLNIVGGAERLVRGMAEELHTRGHAVEVLTTCTDSMTEWNNAYPAGETTINGVAVQRFPLDHLDEGQVYRTASKALSGERVPYGEQLDFVRQYLNSQALYQYLRSHATEFSNVIFAPYLFGTTYFGMQAVPEKAVLLPCIHDEPVAYFTVYRELLEQARGVIFNADAERRFAVERLGMSNQSAAVVGYGFDIPATPGDGARFRERHNLPAELVLYSGRLDAGKNVPLLLDYFTRYKAERPGALTLALSGSGDVVVPNRDDVVGLGFLDDDELRDAYAAATLFCQPSVNESFSIVIMEAWLQNTPVLVHRDCAVTREHVDRSGGGWAFRSYEEFRNALDAAFGDRAEHDRRGQAGRAYVEREYNWDAVIARLLDALADFERPLSLYEQLSRRGVRRALEFSRERFEERFGQVIARAEADQVQGLARGQAEALRTAAHIAMPEYQVQSGAPVVGKLIAQMRRNMTSHLREPYLDPIIARQEQFNTMILDVLLPALERSQHAQQRLERQVRLLEQQLRELRAQDLQREGLGEGEAHPKTPPTSGMLGE
ncbi:MAG TPA: glycosyltransferase family 4 protein, partial [Roseiflexaceae bacterium]|nr:glycosyltransferase family 4 protein [Roseiflexaceae bacterium]